MAQITITRQADGPFHVQTSVGTSHDVSVPAGFATSLGCDHVAVEELIKASFEFLLEREPAASIMRKFSLDVISQYFPSYTAEIRDRLSSGHPGTPQ